MGVVVGLDYYHYIDNVTTGSKDMTQHSNLIKYLEQHGVEAVVASSEAITVRTLFSVEGVGYYETESIPTTMQAVREYLGY